MGKFLVDAFNSRLERQVHEFALGVHLETADDCGVNLVVNGELLACVGRVRLQSLQHLVLLFGREFTGRDDRDLLLSVLKLVETLELLRDLLNIA